MTAAAVRVAAVAVGVWSLIAVIAIINGTLREAVLVPVLGDPAAQVLSLLMLALAVLILEYLLVRGPWRDLPRRWLFAVGALWMLGTVLFEAALGRLVLDMSWNEMLQQYNVLRGRLWPVIPVLLLLGLPLLQAWRRRRGTGR